MSRVSVRKKTNRHPSEAEMRRGQVYIQGAEAPELTPAQIREEKRRSKNKNLIRKNREKAHHMNFGFVMFTLCALVAASVILLGYIKLQSDVTNRINHIASLESQLNDLKLSNDEEYDRIMGSVDLEEIKRIAIEDLGMRYARDGQVVTYSGEGSDYVRQYSDIPKNN